MTRREMFSLSVDERLKQRGALARRERVETKVRMNDRQVVAPIVAAIEDRKVAGHGGQDLRGPHGLGGVTPVDGQLELPRPSDGGGQLRKEPGGFLDVRDRPLATRRADILIDID